MKKFISVLTALVLSAGIILTQYAPTIDSEAYSYSNVTSAAASSKAKPPATLKSLTNETFLKYTNIKSKYKPSSSKEKVYLYSFNTSMSKGFGEDDISLPTEADYGVKGTVSGRKLNVSVYDHTGKKSIKAVYVEGLDASSDLFEKLTLTNGKLQLDTKNYSNGLYRILVDYSGNKAAKLYFYVNGDKTLLCHLEILTEKTANAYVERRTALAKVLKNGKVTPQNSLSLENVWYPFYEFEDGTYNSKWQCDTQKWIDLSDKIVKDNWSDEYKLFKITEWVRENIAYDYFVKEQGKSRAKYFGDYSGVYSTYDLKAGVCFDFVHIIAIMCRAQGIPAVTIGSSEINHVWNAVYVNNRWIEVDGVASEKYHVKGKDVSVRVRSSDGTYSGIYQVMPWDVSIPMPSDAIANQYFQYNSYNVY